MRLLINCDKNLLESKFDVTVLRQIEYLRNIHPETFYCGNGWKYDIKTAYLKYNPDIVLFAADFSYNDWIFAPHCNHSINIMYMQDYWDDVNKRIEILEYGNFDGLITKNLSGTELYQKRFTNLKFCVNPSGFDENIFYPTYEDKKYDILICGILDEVRYPQRFRLSSIANKLSDKIKIFTKPHCNWLRQHNTNPEEHGQTTFANYINDSKLVISGTALMKVYMQKTWEISACSSVCITDLNHIEPEYDLLNKHVKQIDLSLTDDEIADILLYEVRNFDCKVTKKNNEIVYSYATLYHRTNHLLNILKSFM